MAKALGYVLLGLGAVGAAAWAIPQFRNAIPQSSQLIGFLGGETILLVASIVVLLVGLFFATRGGRGGRKGRDLPIFQGRNIVGYRRN